MSFFLAFSSILMCILCDNIYRLCKYFRGNQHLEEIMLKENIQRSQLLTLIDKFSEILVTCTLPEHGKIHK